MSTETDTAALIAEVQELFDEDGCVCTRSGLGDRVLDELKRLASALSAAERMLATTAAHARPAVTREGDAR